MVFLLTFGNGFSADKSGLLPLTPFIEPSVNEFSTNVWKFIVEQNPFVG